MSTSNCARNIRTNLPQNYHHQSPRRCQDFHVEDKVFAATGGGRGLGLALAEALAEAGGQVYCLDRLVEPDAEFLAAQQRADPEFGGSLHYKRIDVRDVQDVDETIAGIAAQSRRLCGLVAAAGVNHVGSAIEHSPADIADVMSINYTGVFNAARCRQADVTVEVSRLDRPRLQHERTRC